MDFIIMDLEWNNTYARKTKGFINEIIEIGAVKLDENLNFKDKFSCLVRPQIGKKLRGSVKELTNITNEEVRSGEPFTKVFFELSPLDRLGVRTAHMGRRRYPRAHRQL